MVVVLHPAGDTTTVHQYRALTSEVRVIIIIFISPPPTPEINPFGNSVRHTASLTISTLQKRVFISDLLSLKALVKCFFQFDPNQAFLQPNKTSNILVVNGKDILRSNKGRGGVVSPVQT